MIVRVELDVTEIDEIRDTSGKMVDAVRLKSSAFNRWGAEVAESSPPILAVGDTLQLELHHATPWSLMTDFVKGLIGMDDEQ